MATSKWSLLIASLGALSCSTALAAGKGATPNGKPFVELQGQIVEVEGEVSSLQDQIESLVVKVDSIEDRVAANENAISDISARNSELQALVSAYGTDLSTLQSEIIRLESENLALRAQLEAGDTTLQAHVDANAAMITTLQQTVSEIGDLQSQIDNNLALIETMQQEIIQINDLLQTKQDILDGQCPVGYALREISADGSIVCEYDNAGSGSGSTVKLDTVLVEAVVDAPTNGWMSKNVFCPSGYIVTGGGFNVFNTQAFRNHSYGVTGWHFNGLNNNNYKNYYVIYANCLKLVQQ